MLSTDSARGDVPGKGRRDVAGRFVGAILPAVAAAALGASLHAGDGTTTYALRAVAPAEVRPASPLPVRAVVFADDGVAAPAVPVAAEVRAWLEAREGGFRTEPVALRRSRALGSEGELPVPAGAPPVATLVVEAAIPGSARARATRRVRIGPDAGAPPSRMPPRSELERLALGPIRAEGDATPPARLELAVPSGSCVPELPCRLEIAASGSVTDVALEPGPHVEVVERSMPHAVAVVRGPEGTIRLVASIDGRVVARRDVRLPLSPGGVSVDVRRPTVRLDEAPGVVARSLSDGALAVDVFRDGRWIGASSIRVRALEPTPVPVAIAGEGAYRVQVQRHVLAEDSADRAGVGLFVVRERGRAPGAVAPSAAEVVLAPPAFEGVSITRAELERSRTRGRRAASVVVLAAGILASALLIRRGLGPARAELFGYVLLVLVAFGAVAAFAWAA